MTEVRRSSHRAVLSPNQCPANLPEEGKVDLMRTFGKTEILPGDNNSSLAGRLEKSLLSGTGFTPSVEVLYVKESLLSVILNSQHTESFCCKEALRIKLILKESVRRLLHSSRRCVFYRVAYPIQRPELHLSLDKTMVGHLGDQNCHSTRDGFRSFRN